MDGGIIKVILRGDEGDETFAGHHDTRTWSVPSAVSTGWFHRFAPRLTGGKRTLYALETLGYSNPDMLMARIVSAERPLDRIFSTENRTFITHPSPIPSIVTRKWTDAFNIWTTYKNALHRL